MNIEDLQTQINDLKQQIQITNPRLSSRYPYTYACDYLRGKFQIRSRSDASQKMEEISRILGEQNHHEVAVAFAEVYLAGGNK